MLDGLAAFYESDPGFFAGSVAVVGLLVGSFLNVVIYRLPIILERQWQSQAAEFLPARDAPATGAPATGAPATGAPSDLPRQFTLSVPRSACPACKAPITAWQNIPVLSWLWLRGRCASCKTKISVRYPAVELATALLSGWVAWHFGFGVNAACGLVVTWALIALTGIDVDHQLLPDDITLPLMWCGLMAAVAFGALPGRSLPVSPAAAVLGAAAGYLSLWSVFQGFRLVTGKEGMGHGDFKLLAALGAWLGWKMLPLILILSACTGAMLGISMILLRGRDRSAPMPFGPYLATAGWLAMIYGDSLVGTYLRVSGLQH